MIRSVATAALVVASVALSGYHALRPATSQAPTGPVQQVPCANQWVNEPLVVFDVSGYSLAGLIHRHLTVYNSGLVTIAEAGGGTTLFPFGSKADVTWLQPDETLKLWKSVMQAGAANICDIMEAVSDVPLTTVTVHRGETDSRAHTYSYLLASTPAASNVEQLILAFIQNTFPNF